MVMVWGMAHRNGRGLRQGLIQRLWKPGIPPPPPQAIPLTTKIDAKIDAKIAKIELFSLKTKKSN